MISIINICDGSVSRLECQMVPMNPTGPQDVKICVISVVHEFGWVVITFK